MLIVFIVFVFIYIDVEIYSAARLLLALLADIAILMLFIAVVIVARLLWLFNLSHCHFDFTVANSISSFCTYITDSNTHFKVSIKSIPLSNRN